MTIPNHKILIVSSLVFIAFTSFAQNSKTKTNLIDHLSAYAKTSSVTGRETQARGYIQSLFNAGELKEDKLGNLVLTIGSGEPKRMIAAQLDEPGYVISKIQEDGYLRIATVGRGHTGNLFHQFLEGHEVVIGTTRGPVIGVATVPSSHFERMRAERESSKGPFKWQEAYIDVGVASATEIRAKGIQLLDPVTLNKKVSVIDNTYISAPAMKSKAAAIALAIVAKSIKPKDLHGTLVITWHSLQLINQKGWRAVANTQDPFEEISFFDNNLPADIKNIYDLPNPEAVMMGNHKVNQIGLPSSYPNTPVETVAISDVEKLVDHWLKFAEAKSSAKELPKVTTSLSGKTYSTHINKETLTGELIRTYGVSGAEENVRKLILEKLPNWAKPSVDEKGNILLSFGQGSEHAVFVAHMDETGYVVEDIKADGTLILKMRGGMLQWLWEAQPAIIHGTKVKITGVFEPRPNYQKADKRYTTSPLTVFAGFSTKKEALDAGIEVGTTTVTMPKEMIRLSENRVTARGFDDRVGSAALLLSLMDLEPNSLKKRITFVWSVEEEIGLHGSNFAAESLKDATIVHPIDTYVSSDDPYADEYFAHCPLGEGAVIRVLESINFISRDNLKAMQDLAKKNNIAVQYGMTAGGTDGQPFLAYGIPSIPLSWPGRYSHSPIEIMDFRDMDNLTALIKAVVNE